jgi:hypothetical protein
MSTREKASYGAVVKPGIMKSTLAFGTRDAGTIYRFEKEVVGDGRLLIPENLPGIPQVDWQWENYHHE